MVKGGVGHLQGIHMNSVTKEISAFDCAAAAMPRSTVCCAVQNIAVIAKESIDGMLCSALWRDVSVMPYHGEVLCADYAATAL